MDSDLINEDYMAKKLLNYPSGKSSLTLYSGSYWVPFPASEYGGTWVVIAENDEECARLLSEISYDEYYNYRISDAIKNAGRFVLAEKDVDGKPYKPGVVDHFFT